MNLKIIFLISILALVSCDSFTTTNATTLTFYGDNQCSNPQGSLDCIADECGTVTQSKGIKQMESASVIIYCTSSESTTLYYYEGNEVCSGTPKVTDMQPGNCYLFSSSSIQFIPFFFLTFFLILFF